MSHKIIIDEAVDITKQELEKVSKDFNDAMDRETFSPQVRMAHLYFPMFDYEKKHLSWWDKFVLWRNEMGERIEMAISVLKGEHECNDDY